MNKLLKLIETDSDFKQIIDLLKNITYNSSSTEDIKINNENVKDEENDELIYEKIWKDYNKGISIINNNNNAIGYFTYLNEGEKLKNNVILNDLDPELVLKINIQDKAVFILLIFIIRTISIAIIEIFIENNMIKTLHYCVMIYALLYLSILLLFIIFINLDSYKLRIIFNYLNTHVNTSNIIIHLVLFSIFVFLVIIIIQTDDFINNAGDILDYTYIYNYIFDFSYNKIVNGEFKNDISPDEKIKLLYRIDIVSMLIFIFTAILTILM